MKILIVSPTFYPLSGGLETYVRLLSRELMLLGHEVTILTNRESETQSIRGSKGNVSLLRTSGLLDGKGWDNYVAWERGYFSLLTDVENLVDPLSFDIVHSHTQVALLLCHLSGIAQKIPLVASFHETNPCRDPLGRERTEFIIRTCPAKKYIVGSEYFKEQAIRFGIPEKKIKTVKMGVKTNLVLNRQASRQKLFARFGIPTDRVMISLIGRYTNRKQHHRLLLAYNQMTLKDNVVIVFVGSTNSVNESYVSSLRSDVKKNALKCVFMLENVSDKWMEIVIAATDIGTQPSSVEGLGLSTIEMMMADVPVVVSDVSGLREAVSYNKTALVDTENSKLYAKKLDYLVSHPANRKKRGLLLGRQAHAQFSIRRSAIETFKVYMTCTGEYEQ